MTVSESEDNVTEMKPKKGLLYSEKTLLSEVLCKPKIIPVKSVTLERLEEMERQASEAARAASQET